MKKFLCVLAAALCVVAAAAGTVEYRKLSTTLLPGVTERDYAVYLPDGFDASRPQPYPVLYLLHGGWGTFTDWPERGGLKAVADSLIACRAIEPLVIVCPDGRYRDNTMWFDTGAWKAQQSFITELIPHIESTYNCGGARGLRAIGGLSLGGGAPLAYAVEFPDMFCAVTAMSSYIRTLPAAPNPSIDWVHAVVDLHDTTAVIEQADEALLQQLRATAWLLDCGVDDFTLGSNIEMDQAMNSRRICHTFVMRPGAHSWHFWTTGLPDALTFANAAFTPTKP